MATAFDVVVVGGGAIGAACARELARAGRAVLVLDRGGTIGQAWRAAAGMLAPQIEARSDDALFRLGIAGREHYPALAASLRETTGIDIGLWQEGIVHVAESEADAAALHRKVAWQQQAGQPVEWVDADDASTRWPWLSPTSGVLWAPREGALEPGKLVEALLTDAHRCGAVITEDTALGIEHRAGRVTHVVGRAGRYSGADVVLAAGAWTSQLAGLPSRVAVEPVRGQMVALPWPAAVPRTIVYSNACYVLRRGSEAIAGSTMEHVGFLAETTVAGIAGIIAAARKLCPALSGEARDHWAGLRPVTPDSLPIVGSDPEVRGLWYATGHGRNGILLAGIMGMLVTRLLDGEATNEDVAPFAPSRFDRNT